MVGSDWLGARLSAAPQAGSRVIGANDRVVLASIGIRGQGNALKRGFARLSNVEIKTLCDIDANLADERINDARLKDVATFKPGFVQDLRRVLDDKDIDAVVIATPNHWHALATIWSVQAGARHGEWTDLMMPVVTKLTDEDFVNIAAYVSSRSPGSQSDAPR